MKKNITIKELSKILEVSISTVSKALNDSYEISESTKERIKAAAKLHNYKPNKLAVNLKSGKTNTIGVVLPSIKNFFLLRVLRGIENFIATTDYNIIISVTNESYDKEVQCVQTLSNGLVDAIIITVSEETQIKQDFSHLKSLAEDMPLLMVDRVVESINCDKVLVDDYDAVYNATKQLISDDRKKIALVSCINNLNVGKLRTKGYVNAINSIHDPIIIEGSEVARDAAKLPPAGTYATHTATNNSSGLCDLCQDPWLFVASVGRSGSTTILDMLEQIPGFYMVPLHWCMPVLRDKPGLACWAHVVRCCDFCLWGAAWAGGREQ